MADNEIMFEGSIEEIKTKNKDLIESVNEKRKTVVTLRNWTSLVYYPLASARQANVSLPEGVDEKMYEKIESVANEIEPIFFGKEYKKISGGNLLEKISLQLNLAIENDSKKFAWPTRSFSLFSVDKAAFSGLISTLISNFGVPKFGAHLEVVLLQEEKEWRVEFILNDEKLTLPSCKGLSVCTVEEFNQFAPSQKFKTFVLSNAAKK